MSSAQTAALAKIARSINEGDEASAPALFSNDFKLHDPGAPDWPTGSAGVQQMIAAFRGLRLDPLEMVEQGDRVCVRWAISGRRDGLEISAACVAIYRFAEGLIAEDWGVAAPTPWP